MDRSKNWRWTLLLLCAGLAMSCSKHATLESAPQPMAATAVDVAEEADSFDDGVVLQNEAVGSEASRARGGALLKSSAAGRLAQAPPAPSSPAGGAEGQASSATPVAEEPTAPPMVSPDPGEAIAGPLLVYTARLNLSVYETAKSLDVVESLAREAGGYLVVRDDQSITIRVPAARFRGVLSGVTALGDVLARNVEVRDVTEEYYDLEIRLRNQEAVLARLQELLRRAENVEAALKVEAELSRVATEVERMKGRLKLLRQLIAYSTITVTFAPTATEQIGSRVQLPFPWLEDLGLGSLLNL